MANSAPSSQRKDQMPINPLDAVERPPVATERDHDLLHQRFL
jgi:hypothetical protein